MGQPYISGVCLGVHKGDGIMLRNTLILILILTSGVYGWDGDTLFVSCEGDSSNTGDSRTQQWPIQMALDSITAGKFLCIAACYWVSETATEGDSVGQNADSVFRYDEDSGLADNQGINSGYAPRLSGNIADGPITIRNYPGLPMPLLMGDTVGGGRRFAYIQSKDSIIYDSLHFWKGRDGIKCENLVEALTVKNCVLTLINKPSNSNWAGAINLHEVDNIDPGLGGREMLFYNNIIDSVMEDGSISGETGGILMSNVQGAIIRKNTISNVYYGATMLGATSATDTSYSGVFDSNTVFNCEYAGLFAFKQGGNRDMDISFNLFYNVGRIFNISAISINFGSVGDNDDIRIYNNTIDCIWPIGDSVEFPSESSNWWHSCGGIGINDGEDSDSLQIYNNLILDLGETHNHGYNDQAIGVLISASANVVDSFYSDYNLVYDSLAEDSTCWAFDTTNAKAWTMTLVDWRTLWADSTYANGVNSISVGNGGWSDPFTDLDNRDYTLTVGSLPATNGRGSPWATYFGYDAPPVSAGRFVKLKDN